MGRSSDLVQKVFGICEEKNGTNIDELLQARAVWHERIWQKSRNKGIRGFLKKFEMEGFMEKRCCGTEERCLRKKVTLLENRRPCMKRIS